MNVEYYLWLNEQVQGPFTIMQLRAMWKSGQLTGQDLYSGNKGKKWLPLADIATRLESSDSRGCAEVLAVFLFLITLLAGSLGFLTFDLGIKVIALLIAAFCFLCSLICFGISRLKT